jgi:hypothetical protein
MAAHGFALEIVWNDEHLLEVCLEARNQAFSGRTYCYVAKHEPEALAECIAGFPISPSDARVYEVGDITDSGMGGARLRFACADGSGHIAVQAEVWGDPREGLGMVSLQFMTVASAIDTFVSALRDLKQREGVRVHLDHAV